MSAIIHSFSRTLFFRGTTATAFRPTPLSIFSYSKSSTPNSRLGCCARNHINCPWRSLSTKTEQPNKQIDNTTTNRTTSNNNSILSNDNHNNALFNQENQPHIQQQRKRLDVAIVGAPNAGKSQLLNCLTQSNVAAVSRKRHTTRDGILGARTMEDINTQFVFIDTPGFLRLKDSRKEGLLIDLIESASNEMIHADYTLVVIDAARNVNDDVKEALVLLMLQAKHSEGRTEEVLEDDDNNNDSDSEEEEPQEKFAIVLNKVDLVHPKDILLDIATDMGAIADGVLKFHDDGTDEGATPKEIDLELLAKISPPIFYISALENDGVDDILKHLSARATPCKAWAVEAGAVTDQTPVERVEELIREKLYRCLHKEVPHQVKQVNRSFRALRNKETGQRAIKIDQDLVVRTKSHQRLVMGKGGMTLKRIKDSAQRDLEEMFKCVVSLHLSVKLRKAQHDENYEPEEYAMNREITWDDLKKKN